MQFLIVWEGDLPTEITWYLKRIEGGWGWAALAIVLGQGLLPFLALLWPPVKRSRWGLAAVCGLLLGGASAGKLVARAARLRRHWNDLVRSGGHAGDRRPLGGAVHLAP